MATVIGESGRYVSDVLARKRRNILAVVLVVTAIMSFIAGLLFGSNLNIAGISPLCKTILAVLAIVTLILINGWSSKKIHLLEQERDNQARGLAGEQLVANILQNLPDAYHVINNLTANKTDIDHFVIGPTGVFAIDTKSWRGVVSVRDKNTVLLNGEPHNLNPFVSRMLGVREKVAAHIPNFELYFKALYVFTAARVEARWGTTGNVYCLRDDQLHEFLIGDKYGKKLSPEEVKRIADVLRGIAHMDSDFNQRA